jgi:tRNA modification GTPase
MHFRVERCPEQHQPILNVAAGDTIAAISTPPGEGAISLVRISGPQAVEIADAIFHGRQRPSTFTPRMQHVGEIRDHNGIVDQVVTTVHRAPASYTGEDLVEIGCHGGVLVTARVLECCLRAGARAARPGEFTERAFLNGKMDLTQAEAVIDLIRARTDLALRSATEQLEGRLGDRVRQIRDQLVALVAHIEAAIDFAEEGIVPDDVIQLRARLECVASDVAELIVTAEQGRLWREGARVVIYGATNAGKSSLLNRLLGHDRVIVSETPGTTRDTVEEGVNLGGIPLRLIDTAGLRAPADQVERLGILRTEKTLKAADLRIQVVDRSAARPDHFSRSAPNEVLVLNKRDLPEHHDWREVAGLRVSCLTGEGLDRVRAAILNHFGANNLALESPVAINARHRDCLRRAGHAISRTLDSLARNTSIEYVAVDLHDAVKAVGEIIGVVDSEEVLDSVFGQFCIGK